jgi:hypothetical protein
VTAWTRMSTRTITGPASDALSETGPQLPMVASLLGNFMAHQRAVAAREVSCTAPAPLVTCRVLNGVALSLTGLADRSAGVASRPHRGQVR